MESTYVRVGTDLIEVVQLLRNPVLDEVFRALTRLGQAPAFVAVALAMTLVCRQRWLGLAVLGLYFVSSPLNSELKDLLDVPRPDPGEVDVLADESGSATPSGHAMNGGAVWFFAALVASGGWRYLLAGVPLVVAFSRVYLGVHYPGDVVLGLAIGGLLAVVVFIGLRRAGLIGAQGPGGFGTETQVNPLLDKERAG
ncbi:MAG: phosphatase PAP2 family protein [Dehalococcoidia bacterium]